MLCREQFLKHPPENFNKCISSPPPTKRIDDATNWQTDNEDDDTDYIRPSRRRRKRLLTQEEIDLSIMKKIFDAQTDEVKQVILSLHQMQMNQRKATREKRSAKATAPRPLLKRKRNKTKQSSAKKKRPKTSAPSVGAGALQNNRKTLARLQRRRHFKRKPRKNQCKKKRAKFPRRRRPRNAKAGNRQHMKRVCRSQKLFNKGLLLMTGRKLMEHIWKSVEDSNGNTVDVCNKNIYHGLSKLHLQQIALYERIEEDLERLSITREERTKAAEERKAKEVQKAELRKDLKDRLIAKAAAHAESDALKKERRAVRKKRALDKKLRQQTAKAEIRLYCKSAV